MSELYRPYSGTEGEAFKAGHCYQCRRFESGCDIELRTMAHSEDDPEYPREWVRTDDGPTCTAFDGIGDEVQP